MGVIWTEKYRPSKFKEVKGQDDIVKRVEAFVKNNNMPHLLFAGPAGIGKSSLAIVSAKELFGEGWRNNFLELNASDERGIDIIINRIKEIIIWPTARKNALENSFLSSDLGFSFAIKKTIKAANDIPVRLIKKRIV